MRKKDKYIVLILLLLASIPTLVSVFLSARSLWIRHEMLERLELEKLHKIVLLENQVNWIDEGSELIIKGDLFDVKQFRKEGQTFIFIGLFDKEETELSNWFEKNKNSNKEDMVLSKLFLHFLKFQYHSATEGQIFRVNDLATTVFTKRSTPLPSSPFIDGSNPPPNCFFI